MIWVVPSIPDSASSTGDVVEINFNDVRIDGSSIGEDVSSVDYVVFFRLRVM